MMNSACRSDGDLVKHLENQLELARREINNLRQQLKSLTHVHQKEVSAIRERLRNWRCEGCQNVVDEAGDKEWKVREIGRVSTNFPEKRGTPRQPNICSETVAKLSLSHEVFTNPEHAVEGLQEFSHMWILFYFHKNESTHVRAKVSPPRLNGERTGVFATRSPHRPSPIGLSLVKIDRIMGNNVYFSGVDMVDQTPVLDIKPYIPQYDNPLMITSESRVPGENVAEEVRPSTSVTVPSGRVMDGEENHSRTDVLGATSSPIPPRGVIDELSYTRLMDVRIGEREAPDGEEEEVPNIPPNTSHITIPTTPEGHIRVPSWITHAPVSTISVIFKDRALQQLTQLGAEGEEKKNIITNVLQEDPRSIYLRERWSSHCYVFRISELCVSCKFNDAAHTVTVYQVFQNNASEHEE